LTKKQFHIFQKTGLLIGIFLLVCSLETKAQYTEYEIKAGMIVNIAKYVEWPAEVFKGQPNKILLGILGDDPFGEYAERVLKGRMEKGRYWEIRRGKTASELKGCHVIFVSKSEEAKINNVLSDILSYGSAAGALTIGDNIDNFCENGGIINIVATETSKYNIYINMIVATEKKITISNHLLRLANQFVTNDKK
jgi:hypothetical protein